jgi:hypothetical protein
VVTVSAVVSTAVDSITAVESTTADHATSTAASTAGPASEPSIAVCAAVDAIVADSSHRKHLHSLLVWLVRL